MNRLRLILFHRSVEPLEVFFVFHSLCIALWQLFVIVDVSNWHLLDTYTTGEQPPVGNFIAIACLNMARLIYLSRNNLLGRIIVAGLAMMLWTASAVVRVGMYPDDREAIFYVTSACGSSLVFFRLMTIWWRLREIGDADIPAVPEGDDSLFIAAGRYGASSRRFKYAFGEPYRQNGGAAAQIKGGAGR